MFKSVEDFQKFSKDQVEAATQSASVLSQGVQQLFAETTALSKKNLEVSRDAFQDLIASKSVDRAWQVQMDFAKTAYDSMIAGTSKLNTIMSATAQDFVKPLEGAFTKIQATARSNVAA